MCLLAPLSVESSTSDCNVSPSEKEGMVFNKAEGTRVW